MSQLYNNIFLIQTHASFNMQFLPKKNKTVEDTKQAALTLYCFD